MTPSIVPQNRLKHLLREGRSAIGTMLVEVRQASVMQVLSNAGLDFVIIDNEHGAFTIETISSLCRAARQVGVTPIVPRAGIVVRSTLPSLWIPVRRLSWRLVSRNRVRSGKSSR